MNWNNIKNNKDFDKIYKTYKNEIEKSHLTNVMFNILKGPSSFHENVHVSNSGKITYFLNIHVDKSKKVNASIIDTTPNNVKERFRCSDKNSEELIKLFIYTNPDAEIIVDLDQKHPFIVQVQDPSTTKTEIYQVSLNILRKLAKRKNIKTTFGQSK